MKKLIILTTLLFINFVFGQYHPTITSTGALQFPLASDFKNSNGIPTINGYRVNIDTTPSVNPFDATISETTYLPQKSFALVVNSDENLGASTSSGWANAAGTRGVWQMPVNNEVRYIASTDLSGDTKATSFGITYAIDYSTTSASANPVYAPAFLYNNSMQFSTFAGTRQRAYISFYAKKLKEDAGNIIIVVGSSGSFCVKVATFDASNFTVGEWVLVQQAVDYTSQTYTNSSRLAIVAPEANNLQEPTYSIAKFNFWIMPQIEYTMPKETNWTDAEFKVLDTDGNLVYWVSTQYGVQMGGEYTTNSATDLNAKIYYTCPENELNGAGKGREWIEFVYSSTDARTIYEHAQKTTGASTPTIGGIMIQPNFTGNTVGGTSISSIFGKVYSDTPSGYSFIYLKCSPLSIEKTADGKAIWRTVQPQPIQKE